MDSCSIWHHGLGTWGDIWPKVYILENLLLLLCQYSLSFWIKSSGCETLKCYGLKTNKNLPALLFFSLYHLPSLTPDSLPTFNILLTIPTDRRWVKCVRSINQSFSYHSGSSMLPVRKYKGRNTGNMSPQVFSTNNRKSKNWKPSHKTHKMLVSCWGKRRGAKAKQLNLILIRQDLSSVTNHRQILHLNSISRGVGSSIFALTKENTSTNILHCICYNK